MLVMETRPYILCIYKYIFFVGSAIKLSRERKSRRSLQHAFPRLRRGRQRGPRFSDERLWSVCSPTFGCMRTTALRDGCCPCFIGRNAVHRSCVCVGRGVKGAAFQETRTICTRIRGAGSFRRTLGLTSVCSLRRIGRRANARLGLSNAI